MPQLTTMKLADLKTEAQVRKTFDEEELRLLGENIKRFGLLQPLLVRKDGVLLAGERRYRAMLLMGIREAQVIVTEKVLSDSEVRLIQLTENMHRADLSGHEKWQACAELMCMNPSWQMKDLAEHVRLDPSMVTRLLSPSKCVPAVQEALAAGKIGISDCYAISKLPEAEQAGLLALKLKGASRDSIEQAGRKSRNGGSPAVKVSRLRCVLPSGVVVQFSGEGIALEDAIEAMKDLTAELKRAIEQGLDSKTVVRVLADKAKKQ
jgi:ParB family transcriptional regulator, chromosome partitioning protein